MNRVLNTPYHKAVLSAVLTTSTRKGIRKILRTPIVTTSKPSLFLSNIYHSLTIVSCMARKMSMGMQAFNIGRMFATANPRYASDMFDIRANLDSTLSYGENARNIKRMTGSGMRNRGMEQFERQGAERERERRRRQNPLRQTGVSRNESMDYARLALPPGRRISRTGHRYYEYRSNRSDVPPTRL
jgi:hypothetical protein